MARSRGGKDRLRLLSAHRLFIAPETSWFFDHNLWTALSPFQGEGKISLAEDHPHILLDHCRFLPSLSGVAQSATPKRDIKLMKMKLNWEEV